MNWLQLLLSQDTDDKKETSDLARSAFERDFDRIIFSHPFRSLQDKTQVFPLPEHDFVHTRLTHSLEVSSVGRSLGKKAGETLIQRNKKLADQQLNQFDFGAIVAAASLTHDIGNPPFGHSGEDAISDFFRSNPSAQNIKTQVSDKEWADLKNFEGNAQGFRLMNKVQGLTLTQACQLAFSKYPRESQLQNIDPHRKSQKKYGFFQSEKDAFEKLALSAGLINLGNTSNKVWCRHPLAFLVEAADDICYHIIDLEDGCRLGLVSYDETRELLANILNERFQPKKLNRYKTNDEKVAVLRAVAIGKLIDECAEVFLDHENDILAGAFDQDLASHIVSKNALNEIQTKSISQIYRSRSVLEKEAAGFEIINGLLESFVISTSNYMSTEVRSKRDKSIIRLLPQAIQDELDKDDVSTYNVVMDCLDFVSGMTDSHAVGLFKRIKGISLPR